MAAINLGDPDFEPTDEQLVELAERAFAGLPAKGRAIQAKLRANIRKAGEALRDADKR